MAGDNIFDSLNFVSRGGQKLAKALDCFKIDPQGETCIDCGASTGGFTDCLLQRGARYVYSIDVGYGQLDWTLRNDPRVCVMERTNIRYVTAQMLLKAGSRDGTPGILPSLAAIDVSFISLSLVMPVMRELGVQTLICLIKPQFEAGKDKVGKGGIVKDPQTHAQVLQAVIKHACDNRYGAAGMTHSPVKGPKGNIEFLGYFKAREDAAVREEPEPDIAALVTAAHEELSK